MVRSTPSGITPPTPGLDREEPEFSREDDIPADDGGTASERERSRPGEEQGERRERGKLERE
jgi:hypothetical protein